MSLRSPCRFCAPGPGRDGNRPGSSDTWGSQSSRSRRHPPHPQSLQEVFVFASAPGSFSFTFLFASGWDSGWKAPGGIPADSLTAFEVRRPPGGNWVAAPSRLRWLSSPTLQPGLDGESIPIYGHVALWSSVPSCSTMVTSYRAQKSMLADNQPI
ncbi:interleukin-15 isoform X2 [Rhinopithecus roxellana]|uniref:interleukin-15 isoform X2 n=1 Tax=Rhinopithecus bieti TaxID=61621 RepID=UPI00083C26E8|nr:PREDICTED: interleukin-15 isoform X2 [Rhinopithecus bieti]XP_017704424.1 PREDICTED: interleukin-15 isoform X2 [Rhinopithecus bieti]XP_017704425.1 PREDICTED: interleukin-15 isoform X2 [Rhinopithecus bieti]XP_030780631.1 interleukin-15 isoform X2 [Rhinopithecus roxellana]